MATRDEVLRQHVADELWNVEGWQEYCCHRMQHGWEQGSCTSRALHDIDGYPFCGAHAAMVLRDLEANARPEPQEIEGQVEER